MQEESTPDDNEEESGPTKPAPLSETADIVGPLF